MNLKQFLPAFATAALFIASCSNHSIDVAQELGRSYKYDGRTIELEGTLSTNHMVWGSTNRESLDLNLRCTTAWDNTKIETVTGIIVHYGTSPNSVIINIAPDAKEFRASDVCIYDNKGEKLAMTDKVKITGKVTYTAKGPKKEAGGFKIKVPVVNKEEKKEDNDYSYKITEVRIEKI